MCSSAPDTSAQNAIAANQVAMSQEQLAWAKQLYGETAPDRAAATQRAAAVSDAALDSMQTQTSIAKDYQDYNTSTFRPVEQRIVGDAMAYDTPERREAEAAKARAGVGIQLSNARASSNRDLERSGVAPGSGKQLSLSSALDLGGAKAMAGADSAARKQVETVGAAKLADAANMGRGLASNQATAAGLALSSGQASTGAATTGLNTATSGSTIMNQGYAGAMAGLNSAASIYGQIANEQAGSDSGLFGALGQIGGAAISKYSDKNIKHDREKVSGKISLAQVEALPSNESWRYDKGSVADDGEQLHQGHMAQDVNRVMGDDAAPGGKVINLERMASVGLAAIKEVSKKQVRLEKRVLRLSDARRA